MSNACSSTCNLWRKGILFAAAIAIGVWAIMTALDRYNRPPEPETVEVCVATKDLPVGTYITPEDVNQMVTRVRVPKDGAPEGVVVEEAQLHDKRITRPWRKGEMFKLPDLLKGGYVRLPEGMVIVSFPTDVSHDDGRRVIGPGDRANIIATVQREDKLESVPLVQDSLIIAVNTAGWSPSMFSVAVDRDTLELLRLARNRKCKLSAKLSDTAQPSGSQPVDAARVRQFLESLPLATPEEAAPTREVAPAPRLKSPPP
jgi:Flp pilus assembly protein CpaB